MDMILKFAYNRDDAEDGIGFSDASASVDQLVKQVLLDMTQMMLFM